VDTKLHQYGKLCILVWVALVSMAPAVSSGFYEDTHRKLTAKSITNSQADNYITNNLGLTEGIDTLVTGDRLGSSRTQALGDWLQDGSQFEDDPICRASNHFHNPTKEFSASAVTDLMAAGQWCWGTSPEYRHVYSNVTWGTRFTAPDRKGEASGNLSDWDATTAQVQAYDLAVVQNVLRKRWNDLKDALRRSDIQNATNQVTARSRARYQAIFQALLPDLPNIDSILTDLQLLEIREREAICEMIRHDTDGGRSFEVRFRLDEDGIWRIQSF
jgi:hypothetical protein